MAKRKPLFVEVADKLIDLIRDDYPPGSKIPIEPELAEMFSVSRTTIRSAISSLCSRNILEIRRGDGTYVTDVPGLSSDALGIQFLDPEEIEKDIREVSLMLQPASVNLAASVLTEEASEEMRSAIAWLEKEWAKYQEGESDYQTLRMADTAFHSAAMRASGNHIIDRIDVSLKEFSENRRENRNIKILEDSLEMHPKIYEAILSGDGNLAEKLMREHLERVGQYLKAR